VFGICLSAAQPIPHFNPLTVAEWVDEEWVVSVAVMDRGEEAVEQGRDLDQAA